MLKSSQVVIGVVLGCVVTWAWGAKSYGQALCDGPEYSCHQVKYKQTWESLFPDKQQRALVQALNRTNMPLRYQKIIAVPNQLEGMTMMDIAPFDHQIAPPGEKVVVVNLKELAFGAYSSQGKLVHWGPVSGGKNWCPDTNSACHTVTGDFRVYAKRGKHCVSNKFPVEVIGGGAPMPYCMFFHGGYALHASTTVPGYNASHGCVRMFYKDARWLSKYFVSHGAKGTRVIVNNS